MIKRRLGSEIGDMCICGLLNEGNSIVFLVVPKSYLWEFHYGVLHGKTPFPIRSDNNRSNLLELLSSSVKDTLHDVINTSLSCGFMSSTSVNPHHRCQCATM